MGNLSAAFITDLVRPSLWRDAAVGSLLVGALAGTLYILAYFESGPSSPGTEAVLLKSALSLVLTGSALVGSFAFTSAFRTGSLHLRVLLFQRIPAFAARAGTTMVAASALGVATAELCAALGALVSGTTGIHAPGVFAATGCMGAAWGYSIGSVVRNHQVSLFLVPLTLVLPGLAAQLMQEAGQFVFPLAAADWADRAILSQPASWSLLTSLGWLATVGAVALGVFTKRDLA